MIHNSTAHRVFTIEELVRPIADQLVLTGNQKSAVNLARVCRCLEEPVLSTLWATELSLQTLLMVLPRKNRYEGWDNVVRIFGDPSPKAWTRVWRCASWMRRVRVYDSSLGGDTFLKLRLNSPVGGWFPALQDLLWCITKHNLPHAELFLSPHLKKIRIFMAQAWRSSGVPRDLLPVIASTISTLPTSSLEQLLLDGTRHRRVSWAYFKESFSSVVLRCGSSLTQFSSPVPLSDAAVDYLIHLPHLCTWHVEGPPPTYSTSQLPLVFPPLAKFTLGRDTARGWLSLFERLEHGASATQGVTPLAKVKGSLKYLKVWDSNSPCPIVDASFASTVRIFRNLVHLDVGIDCPYEYGEGQCTFKLNDGNVTELATALPRLVSLFLGRPCFKNSCATTLACLLPISVRCRKLEKLEIHFNTTNIVDDINNILGGTRFEELRSLPKCTLSHLDVHGTPLALDKPGFENVASAMVGIFPSLEHCQGRDQPWIELSAAIRKCKPPKRVADEA